MDDALRSHARAIGDRIRRAELRGAALVDEIGRVPFVERDAFVDEALAIGEVPDDVALPRGSVPYIPCGVDALLHAIRDASITDSDVFVDYGAGVGRAALVVHLLTGARAIGVEIQPALVARAHELAKSLRADVHIEHGDARDFDVDGTVHFIYASFDTSVVRCVLDRVRKRKTARVVVAVGFDLDEPWLRARTSTSPEVALYDVVVE